MSNRHKITSPRTIPDTEEGRLARRRLAWLSTQGVIPGACLDCDGVAVVRPVSEAFHVHTFHRDTCPAWRVLQDEDQ